MICCSNEFPINLQFADTFNLEVDQGKTYLVRMVNAAMNNILFFGIANHKITVVGSDGAYTKPLKRDHIAISPGQTIDFLLEANQEPNHYYIAANVFGTPPRTSTTAILKYRGNYTQFSPPIFPNNLPIFNDTNASFNFTKSLKSLASKEHPINVPKGNSNKKMTKLFFTLSVNTIPCENNNNCDLGPQNGTLRLKASVNNISFVNPPNFNILEAYYNNINGVYGDNFPSKPPFKYNYTGDNLPLELWTPELGTEVKVIEYDSEVELVFQSTSLLGGIDHPMHLHGYSFYVVGLGLGTYNASEAKYYNLDDPPLVNTITVPRRGWAAIRFKANNPGKQACLFPSIFFLVSMYICKQWVVCEKNGTMNLF